MVKFQNSITFLDYFDFIYCINLNRRRDRWKKVQKEFERMGVLHKVFRFDAIENFENGHIGCALSHRNIIQDAKIKGYKNILIFEDDIFFRYSSDYMFKVTQELALTDWDIFYF